MFIFNFSRTLPSKGFPNIGDRYGESGSRYGETGSSPARRISGQSQHGPMSSSPVRTLEADRKQNRSVCRSRERHDRGDQSNMSLDSSLTLLDNTVNSASSSGVWNRSSLMEALKQEKETRPESFWRV